MIELLEKYGVVGFIDKDAFIYKSKPLAEDDLKYINYFFPENLKEENDLYFCISKSPKPKNYDDLKLDGNPRLKMYETI